MFAKTIELKAAKQEFLFTYGMKEARFRPVIYLSLDRRVLAIGDMPEEGAGAGKAHHVFVDRNLDEAFALLETLMRYGVRLVLGGGWHFGPITMRISIDRELREDLLGFAPAIFQHAARGSGAAKVVIE